MANRSKTTSASSQTPRADARRNADAILVAAKSVFATSGVDAPVREIATEAGVGIATLYRRFPKRSDLVAAVFRREIDICAEAAKKLSKTHSPPEALRRWLMRYTDFIVTKKGLSSLLHSGDPAFDGLQEHFRASFEPALALLLDDASATGQVRDDVEPISRRSF